MSLLICLRRCWSASPRHWRQENLLKSAVSELSLCVRRGAGLDATRKPERKCRSCPGACSCFARAMFSRPGSTARCHPWTMTNERPRGRCGGIACCPVPAEKGTQCFPHDQRGSRRPAYSTARSALLGNKVSASEAAEAWWRTPILSARRYLAAATHLGSLVYSRVYHQGSAAPVA